MLDQIMNQLQEVKSSFDDLSFTHNYRKFNTNICHLPNHALCCEGYSYMNNNLEDENKSQFLKYPFSNVGNA